MAARVARIRQTLANGLPDPARPLTTPRREEFCQLVASGVAVAIAYRRVGYDGGDACRSQLRRSPDVDARINWLIAKRIESDTEARHKREKPLANLKSRVVRELERLAFSDARSVQQWTREPVMDAEGNVSGYRDVLIATPSHKLKAGEAAAIKGVRTKGGVVQVEMHDKLAALDKLGRMLGLFQDAAPAPSVTVNQMNVGEQPALELARKLAFALAAAQRATLRAPDPSPIIDANPANSE